MAATSSGKSPVKKLERIVEKMRSMEASRNSVYPMILKWRMYRFVTGWRPPPGGPMAPTHTRSTIFMKVRVLRSNQPPWSAHWRSSSIGGCAPYSSFLGMFKSSTSMTYCLPDGGPKTPLRRLSILPSRISCVMFADVWAENVRVSGSCFCALRPSCRYFMTFTVLPVPETPVCRHIFLFFDSWSNR